MDGGEVKIAHWLEETRFVGEWLGALSRAEYAPRPSMR
jgi:hypothetical protein